MSRPVWVLTEHAVSRGAHALGCSRDRAEGLLYERMPRATYRATDRDGRELHRSPPRDRGLRWVVDPARGTVVWVGQGAPPAEHWGPAPDEATRGEERITVTIDRAALRMLDELAEGPAARGAVIGRALRVLYNQERRR